MIWLAKIPCINAAYYGESCDYGGSFDAFAAFVVKTLVGDVAPGANTMIAVDIFQVKSNGDFLGLASRTVIAKVRKMTLVEWNVIYSTAIKKHGSLAVRQAYEKATNADYDALAERFNAALPK